jgi:hypothetical protein
MSRFPDGSYLYACSRMGVCSILCRCAFHSFLYYIIFSLRIKSLFTSLAEQSVTSAAIPTVQLSSSKTFPASCLRSFHTQYQTVTESCLSLRRSALSCPSPYDCRLLVSYRSSSVLYHSL